MQGLEGTDRERVFKSYYPMQRATLKLEVGRAGARSRADAGA